MTENIGGGMKAGHGIDGDSPNTHHLLRWIPSVRANEYLHRRHYYCGGSADGGHWIPSVSANNYVHRRHYRCGESADGGTGRDGGSAPGDNQADCKRKSNHSDHLDP